MIADDRRWTWFITCLVAWSELGSMNFHTVTYVGNFSCAALWRQAGLAVPGAKLRGCSAAGPLGSVRRGHHKWQCHPMPDKGIITSKGFGDLEPSWDLQTNTISLQRCTLREDAEVHLCLRPKTLEAVFKMLYINRWLQCSIGNKIYFYLQKNKMLRSRC